MRASMLEVGKSIVSWPQLGGAATLNGCAVAYCVRAIVCGQPLIDNRALVSLDQILSPVEYSPAEQEARSRSAREFALMLDAVDAALREFCPTGALVAGHSVGGWAALRLAANRHPAIRKVVAVDAMGFTDFFPPRYSAFAWRA